MVRMGCTCSRDLSHQHCHHRHSHQGCHRATIRHHFAILDSQQPSNEKRLVPNLGEKDQRERLGKPRSEGLQSDEGTGITALFWPGEKKTKTKARRIQNNRKYPMTSGWGLAPQGTHEVCAFFPSGSLNFDSERFFQRRRRCLPRRNL